MANLINRVRGIFSYLPLTLRGVVALSFSALLIFYFAGKYSDLVAAILGAALLLLFIVCLSTLMFTTPIIKRRLVISSKDSGGRFISHMKNDSGFSLDGLHIPAFFYLKISRNFKNTGIIHDTHVFTGRFGTRGMADSSRSYFLDKIKFPYRGEYIADGFEVYYGDIF